MEPFLKGLQESRPHGALHRQLWNSCRVVKYRQLSKKMGQLDKYPPLSTPLDKKVKFVNPSCSAFLHKSTYVNGSATLRRASFQLLQRRKGPSGPKGEFGGRTEKGQTDRVKTPGLKELDELPCFRVSPHVACQDDTLFIPIRDTQCSVVFNLLALYCASSSGPESQLGHQRLASLLNRLSSLSSET